MTTLSRGEFDRCAHEFATQNPTWRVRVVASPLCLVEEVVLERALVPVAPFACGTTDGGVVGGDAERKEEDDGGFDDCGADDECVGMGEGNACGHNVFAECFVTFSEAYQLPQFHFALLRKSGNGGGAALVPFADVRWLQAAFPRINTQGEDTGPRATAPIVSHSYCDELRRALFSVHQCDMLGMLQMAAELRARVPNPVGYLIAAVAGFLPFFSP